MKKYLPLIIAAAAGLLAAFLVNVYLQQQAEEVKKKVVETQKNLTSVVVATEDIPAGATINEKMVKEITINVAMLQPRAATSLDRVVNKIAVAPIGKDEQILLNKLTVTGQEFSLSAKVPPGKRAITIPVDNIASVGGMIRPGDRVDVMGVVPIPVTTPEGKQVNQLTHLPLFQNVLVLAVGQDFVSASSGQKQSVTSSPIITLALAPQEANLISFVQEQGKIRLILRSPQDAQIQPAVPATWDTLLKTVMPQAFQETTQPQKSEQKTSREKQVEIIRGLEREVRTISY